MDTPVSVKTVALVKSYSVRFRNGFLRKRDAKCSHFLELAENTGLKWHVVGRQFAVRDLEDANMATFLSDLLCAHGIGHDQHHERDAVRNRPRDATTFVLVAVFISGIAIVASY